MAERPSGGAPRAPAWLRGLRVVAGVLSAIGALAIVAAAAVLVFTGTDWGRERIRRVAQNELNGMIHGRARIGRLSGNLLVGMTVHDVSITDSAGAPFVAVSSFRGDYSIMALLRKRIWIDGAVAAEPVIVLDRPPNGTWNWQRIFAHTGPASPPNQPPSWGSWIRFTNARIENGTLVVRTPWSPSARLSARAQDSVVRDALRGGTRLMIQAAARAGYQKIVQLDSITATVPLLRLSDPAYNTRLAQVSTLQTVAFPFRPPPAVIRDVKGSFNFNNDSVWWKDAYVALPASKASGDGSYVLDNGDMTIDTHADPASFADLTWLYPRLPGNGHGSLDFGLRWRGAVQDYIAQHASIALTTAQGTAHAAGAFGITMGDTIAIHDTHLQFSGVDTRTLEQLIPHFKSPRRGTFAGRAAVSGGRHALAVNGDVTFDDQRAGASRVVASGQIGFPGHGLSAHDLHVEMLPVQVSMAQTWMPSLPVAGTVTGTATINGSTDGQLAVAANIDHRDRGTRSAVSGTASLHLQGRKAFVIDADAKPVSLVEVGRFFPAAGLQGSAAGPVHVTGTLADLRVRGDLRLPDGGRFSAQGSLDLASAEKGYDLTGTLHTLNLRTIDSKAPTTSLTAVAMARGRGFSPGTMRGAFAADASTSSLDTIVVDSLSLRANVGDGVAQIARLYARGAHTVAAATGSFGLAAGRTGQLTYAVDVDSLGAYNRWLPRTAADTGVVEPRPEVLATALRRARADSARVARATELQRALNGQPAPPLVVHAPPPVPRDTMTGHIRARGTLAGNIDDFDLDGTASGDSVIARGNSIRRFAATYVWEHARTPQAKLALGVDADSVSAMGFALDSVRARVTYQSPGGHVVLAIRQSDNRDYGAEGDYAIHTDRKELQLASMLVRLDTAVWQLARPAAFEWGGPGLRVLNFDLRSRSNEKAGRVYANGLLPTAGTADFTMDVENFPVVDAIDLAQTDIQATGYVDLAASMSGTLSAPAFRGAFGMVQGTYDSVAVPELHGTFGYADQNLVAHAELMRNGGQPMTTIDGHLPVDLAFTGVTGPRLLPDPMSMDLVADSLPLELIPAFTDVVSNLHGRMAGQMSLRGTLRRPSITGGFVWSQGTVTVGLTGATVNDIGATIRMARDTVFVDSIAGQARGPVRVRGSLAIGNWREPAFNLYLVSKGAELIHNQWGTIRADAGLALTGPFDGAYLSGAVTVAQGIVNAPEPSGRHVIGSGDPALFNVIDTAATVDRDLFPAQSPLLANLRVDVTLAVKRDTWVRNREANVEVYTDDPLLVHEEQDALALTGAITTDRGEYEFMSKRFQIQRGSAMFTGSPDLDPILEITGDYQVEAAARGALNISVVIGGTLRKPKLTLESDAQPPQTQSELLSLLAFGQSTTSLLAFNSSSIASGGGATDLVGAGAQLAVRRLASVALGVAVEQVEQDAGRAFGTDVFDITPGDVPTELAFGSGVASFFAQTKFEAGKYINGRTYVSGQEQASRLGLSVEHRTTDGWIFTASLQPRLILEEPTLATQPYRTVQSYGGFVLREWRF